MNRRLMLAKIRLLFGLTIAAVLFAIGCGGATSDWTPGDEQFVRELVSNTSEFRHDRKKLHTLFTEEAAPDKAWLSASNDWSFVVSKIDFETDAANVAIDIENNFGEIINTAVWKCDKVGENWLISDAPLPSP